MLNLCDGGAVGPGRLRPYPATLFDREEKYTWLIAKAGERGGAVG